MAQITTVEPEVPAVVTHVPAIMTQIVEVLFVSVKGNVSAILADVSTVVANIHPVAAEVPMVIKTTLSLGSSGSQQQTGYHQYGKFLFHDLKFLCGSIANSYIRRRRGWPV